MNLRRFILLVFACLFTWLSGQVPQHSISVNPTILRESWYDYMIGGYLGTPVITHGAGNTLYMTFHAQLTHQAQRRVNYARVSYTGNLEYGETIGYLIQNQGYSAGAMDLASGQPVFVWHESVNGTTDVPILLGDNTGPEPWMDIFCLIDNPFPTSISDDNSFIWPTVTIGPSPITGRQRMYVMARNANRYTPTNYNTNNPLIAYSDFYVNGSYFMGPWTYITVPELDTWWLDSQLYRKFTGTMVCGQDGKVYLIGNHNEYNDATEIELQFQTVFINDSYGEGNWRRISIPASQIQSQLTNTDFSWLNDMHFGLMDSEHFNPVLDNIGRIHIPQLYTGKISDSAYYPNLYSLRDVWFDTATETFTINDLFPQGASPHNEPCYTPWDVDENGEIDLVIGGQPAFTSYFPFPYWDATAHDNSMFFHNNIMRMSKANQDGIMACVWSDSKLAVNGAPFPGPETYIAISPDNGDTWLDPIVLNPLNEPTLSQTMTFVYPADELLYMGLDNDGNRIYRLFLMYYNDGNWGVSSISSSSSMPALGQVMYMAVDVLLPPVTNVDAVVPSPAVTLQSYPNPFNPSTTISYQLNSTSSVTLVIYNQKGQKVKELLNTTQPGGSYSSTWNGLDDNGRACSSGVYLCKLQYGGRTTSLKLMLMK